MLCEREREIGIFKNYRSIAKFSFFFSKSYIQTEITHYNSALKIDVKKGTNELAYRLVRILGGRGLFCNRVRLLGGAGSGSSDRWLVLARTDFPNVSKSSSYKVGVG